MGDSSQLADGSGREAVVSTARWFTLAHAEWSAHELPVAVPTNRTVLPRGCARGWPAST